MQEGACLGIVADPLGIDEARAIADKPGVVIGRSELPLVNEGDALFHVAVFKAPDRVANGVEDFHAHLDDSLLDKA